MPIDFVSGSAAAISSLTALGLLPSSNLLVETPDLSQMTQVTAENDEVRSGQWFSPLRDGGVSIRFGEDWAPETQEIAEAGIIPEEYYDDAQRFNYLGDCNWVGTLAYLDDQDRLQLSNYREQTAKACGIATTEDESALVSVLDTDNTTLHLDEEGDLWIVAGEDAMEMQRERPEKSDLRGSSAPALSSLSSR